MPKIPRFNIGRMTQTLRNQSKKLRQERKFAFSAMAFNSLRQFKNRKNLSTKTVVRILNPFYSYPMIPFHLRYPWDQQRVEIKFGYRDIYLLSKLLLDITILKDEVPLFNKFTAKKVFEESEMAEHPLWEAQDRKERELLQLIYSWGIYLKEIDLTGQDVEGFTPAELRNSFFLTPIDYGSRKIFGVQLMGEKNNKTYLIPLLEERKA